MLSKYKIAVFNSAWSLTLITATAFLYPYIFLGSQIESEKKAPVEQILHSGSKRTVWKRGNHPSVTTINEKASQSSADEKSHSSSGWTTINWRKGDS